MAEFPSVTVDLSEQLEFPGDSYPLTGKVDVAAFTVGEKEYQLQDGIAYDVVFTNAGTAFCSRAWSAPTPPASAIAA